MTRPIIIASTLLLLVAGCDEKKDAAPTADDAKAAAAADAKPAEKKADAAQPKAAAHGDMAHAKDAHTKDAHAKFTNHSPDAVEKLLADKGCVPVDANGDATREKYGTLPGAVLLTSDTKYDVSELPEDKDANLVFYCGSQACMSAPKAAEVAQAAGYKNVSVMRAGIKGWVEEGKDTDKPGAAEKKAG
ncbi:MAG: rhodanese-like domain-containing protein [Myxococcota bacterium]